MKKTIFFSVLFLSGIGLYAQNVTTQTIRWHVARVMDVNSGRISDDADQIVSYGTTKIEWLDARNVVKQTFTINETNGSWTNVAGNGSILYGVSAGDRQGTVTFLRTPSELTIRIVLLKGSDEDPDLYEMTISDITTL